eukprot:TRINITY_DN5572_c0_g1_i1.p1 TRINITY_DN5572_c0_g1~~TRINITY_DN5572_c0_g1_i1.p1  ORF type:complete len:350 (-),score=69.36 TRINITY_DN5572_c0_g1_i1:24-1073(-)
MTLRPSISTLSSSSAASDVYKRQPLCTQEKKRKNQSRIGIRKLRGKIGCYQKKITKIMINKPKQISYLDQGQSQQQLSINNNANNNLNNNTSKMYENSKSLNKIMRKQELVKITVENLKILKRISESKPHYIAQELARDQIEHQKYLSNICEFPVINKNMSQERISLLNSSQQSKGGEKTLSQFNYSLGQKKEFALTGGKFNQEKIGENFKQQQMENQIVLCKKAIKIGNKNYNCKVFTANKKFFITLEELTDHNQYQLQLHKYQGLEMIRKEFKNNFQKLPDAITEINNQIVLLCKNYSYQFTMIEKFEETSQKDEKKMVENNDNKICLLYTSPSPRDRQKSRMPSSA